MHLPPITRNLLWIMAAVFLLTAIFCNSTNPLYVVAIWRV